MSTEAPSRGGRSAPPVTVVGGGLAGLVASIACAERGASVRLVEAHDELGGRARSTDGPYRANLEPPDGSVGRLTGPAVVDRGPRD